MHTHPRQSVSADGRASKKGVEPSVRDSVFSAESRNIRHAVSGDRKLHGSFIFVFCFSACFLMRAIAADISKTLEVLVR